MKIIRVALLVMALAGSTYAGDIPNLVQSAGDIPNNAPAAAGDIPNGVTAAGDIPYGVPLLDLVLILL